MQDKIHIYAKYFMVFCLLVSLFFIPTSSAVMRFSALFSLPALLACWLSRPGEALIRVFPWRWLYVLLLLWFGIICFFALDPALSRSGLWSALYCGFMLFFVSLESSRVAGAVRLLPWVLALLGFVQGIDGIYQYITGVDFIRGFPIIVNRLTGSFSNYRVGDLLALTFAGSLALPYVMPKAWPRLRRAVICCVLWAPCLFVIAFAQSRSGWLGATLAIAAFYALHKGISWRWVLPLLIAFVLLLFFGFERIRLDTILNDGRFEELWPAAWEIFLHHPITGSGINGFITALVEHNIVLPRHGLNFVYPHNIYLELLCGTGIIGLFLFILFFAPLLVWSWRILRRFRLKQMAAAFPDPLLQSIWAVGAACWGGTAAHLVMGTFAQPMFRPWWLAISMSLTGMMAGICCLLDHKKKSA